MDTDHWPEDDSTETECDHCGNVRLCQHLPDPFKSEVHPEDDNESTWWCRPCYEARHDEV